MVRKALFTSLLASSALVLAVATPAYADKKDRAQEAIAAAEAKLHTAEGIGAGVETPAATANARAALMTAKENLAAGHKSLAIEQAIHASALADTAVGELQRRKNASIAAAHESERATAAAAQDRVDAAGQQAATAQAQAAAADARASSAEQAAASSAADAAAARAAAALAASQPTQVQTTVTTQHQPAVVHRTTKSRVVKKPAPTTTTTRVTPASDQVTTTTTVTPH